ncbi:hypothetical protein QYE76_026762 [Lolium multiflorum]|uniref:RNase H type-1 domain-containing protein n=1 Tax=Lolium multiflorum TaxID=4521 RepID=A0AAD8VXX6_LOLMU|nr:hypothetical protein QYE76_026762 [Lolium multiflorum]
MVAMTFQCGGHGGSAAGGHRCRNSAPRTYEEYGDMPCLAHIDPANGKSSTNRNCKWSMISSPTRSRIQARRKHAHTAKEARARIRKRMKRVPRRWMRMTLRRIPKRLPWLTNPTPSSKSAGAYHTFLGTPAGDHPTIIPKECYALVVSPRIDGYDFSKFLMDGGASLNIMYLETLERMNLTKQVKQHPVPFSYHVIFGRPTYHKFHARECYIYNKLKIQVLTLQTIWREYEALLHGLCIAKEIGIKHIICYGDSDLVAQQVAGTWNARNSFMAAYRDEVDEIAKCFLGYEVKYVKRDDNTAADMLSKLGSGRKPIPPGIFLEHLRIPSVKGANLENPDVAVSLAKEVMAIIPAWTQPFLDYLIDRRLPEDEVLARQIIRRARSYTIVDGQLYKRSANGVFLKCVLMSTGASILVDSVGPPRAEVCRTAASFP